jgi:hypothetical protein
MLGEVDHLDLAADAPLGEVDDDVEALGHAHDVERTDGQSLRQQVAVVGDQVEGLAVAQRDLVHARDRTIEDAEAVLAALDLEVRLVGKVDGDEVAQGALGVEDVERQLAARIERLVREHQVDVVLEVAPILGGAARQPQVDAVVDGLVAAVDGAVDVVQGAVALVDVLRRELEHVVVNQCELIVSAKSPGILVMPPLPFGVPARMSVAAVLTVVNPASTSGQ